jgi:hypothetical protein
MIENEGHLRAPPGERESLGERVVLQAQRLRAPAAQLDSRLMRDAPPEPASTTVAAALKSVALVFTFIYETLYHI